MLAFAVRKYQVFGAFLSFSVLKTLKKGGMAVGFDIEDKVPFILLNLAHTWSIGIQGITRQNKGFFWVLLFESW